MRSVADHIVASVASLRTSVIRKKSNILYINFDLQIQIVAIFRRKKVFDNFQNGRFTEFQFFDSFWL